MSWNGVGKLHVVLLSHSFIHLRSISFRYMYIQLNENYYMYLPIWTCRIASHTNLYWLWKRKTFSYSNAQKIQFYIDGYSRQSRPKCHLSLQLHFSGVTFYYKHWLYRPMDTKKSQKIILLLIVFYFHYKNKITASHLFEKITRVKEYNVSVWKTGGSCCLNISRQAH